MTGEMQLPDALISVIVPVYKAEQTLDRCVGSIVSQTYRNLEIILVDDGSPDDCPVMCDTWSVKDARIKVVHQKNGGVAKARNVGLACATGDLLAWVDSDDWIDQHYLDELYQLLVESNADMAVSKKRVESNSACALVSDAEEIMQMHVLGRFGFELWRTLTKTEKYSNLQFQELKVGEDADMLMRVRSRCSRITVSHIQGYHYSISEQSSVHGVGIDSKLDWMRSQRMQEQYIAAHHPNLLGCAKYNRVYAFSLMLRGLRGADKNNAITELKKKLRRGIITALPALPWSLLNASEKREAMAALKVIVLG